MEEPIIDEIDDDVYLWLRAKLDKALKAELAKQPWWCLLCGEGGNYEGERPDEYWFPPENHICKFKVDPVNGEPIGV